MAFDNIVTLLIGLGIFAVVGLYGWICIKRYKVPFGPAIMADLSIESESYLVAITIGAMVASSIMAAVVHAPNVLAQPLFARILIHSFIGVIGLVAILTVFHEIRKVFEKGLKGSEIFWRLVIIAILIALAGGAPYANLILMAKNVGQAELFDVWWFSFRGGDPKVVGEFMERLGFNKEMTPWGAMQPTLCGELVLVMMHAGIITIEGCRQIASKDRRDYIGSKEVKFEAPKKEKEEEKVPTKKEDAPEEKPSEPEAKEETTPEDIIGFVLHRLNYKDARFSNVKTALLKKLGELSNDKQVSFVTELTILVSTAKNIDKKKSSVDKQENIKQMIELIKSSPNPSPGRAPGLGFTLNRN